MNARSEWHRQPICCSGGRYLQQGWRFQDQSPEIRAATGNVPQAAIRKP
jgi:hypothetical protein